jgi:hypothetical protein
MRKYLTPKEEFDTRKHLRHYPRPYSNIGLRATFGYACKLPMPGPTFLRDINEARVLRLLKEKGVLSRAELARYLGSTRSTVTLVSNELIKEGLIVPTGEGFVTQHTGRPGAALKLRPEGAFFLGAELGAKEIHLVLINLVGAIIYRETVPHRSTKPNVVCQDLLDLVRRVWSKRLKNSDRLRGLWKPTLVETICWLLINERVEKQRT